MIKFHAMDLGLYNRGPRRGNPLNISCQRELFMDGDYTVVMPQSMGDVLCLETCAKLFRYFDRDIAEAGVYYGATARLLMRWFEGTNKTIHLFDTFDVMPPAGKNDKPEYWIEKTGLSVNRVRILLEDYEKQGLVKFYKGLFKDTLCAAKDNKFCFVHIDCDLYEGARDACEFFYPRMVKGGVMMFHDYDVIAFPGIRRAVEEYFMFKDDLRISNRYGFHHVVVKK